MSDHEDGDEKGERIAKRLARAGLCSRRDAERWIVEGRVVVNGKKLDSPACVVGEGDTIVVDGKPLPEAERTRVWRYNKPTGLVTTHKDDLGRPTVFERLPADMPRVISVGRLDLNSEGLLLLTNDGALARELELPSRGWVRRYRVRVFGRPEPAELAGLEKGVTVDGVKYGPIKAVLDSQAASNAWLTVSLQEGKNREIRKVMEHMGWDVSRLIRVAYGPFQLGNLPEREVEEVTGKVIKDQLGVKPKRKAESSEAAEPQPPAEPKPDQSWAKPNIARPRPHAAKPVPRPVQAKREERKPQPRREEFAAESRREEAPERGRDHTPTERGRDHTPTERGRDHTPAERGRDHTPAERGRDHTSAERGRDHTPTEPKRDHTPTEPKREAKPKRQDGWAKAKPKDIKPKSRRGDIAAKGDDAKPERATKAKPERVSKGKPERPRASDAKPTKPTKPANPTKPSESKQRPDAAKAKPDRRKVKSNENRRRRP